MTKAEPHEGGDERERVFDEVMDTQEHPHPKHREHGKEDPRPDEEELESRTEVERAEVGLPPEPDQA